VRPHWLLLGYFEVLVEEPALESVLPDGLLLGLADVLPEALPEVSLDVLDPYWRKHWSRSRPVLSAH